MNAGKRRDLMMDREYEFMKKVNRAVLIVTWMVAIINIAGYTAQYLKGHRTLAFLVVFVALLSAIGLTTSILYRRNAGNHLIKHLTFFGFFFAYSHAMFTAEFFYTAFSVYGFTLIYSLYADKKLSYVHSAFLAGVNMAYIGFRLVQGFHADTDAAQYMLQVGILTIYLFSLIMVTRVLADLRDTSERHIIQAEHSMAAMTDTAQTALVLSRQVQQVSGRMERDNKSLSERTHEQAASLEQIEGTMAGLGRSFQSITELSQQMEQLFATNLTVIHESEQSVQETVGTIEEYQQQTDRPDY